MSALSVQGPSAPSLLAQVGGVADVLTALIWLSIPLALVVMVAGGRRDRDYRDAAWLLAVLILAGAADHLASAYGVWNPSPEAEGAVKLAATLATVISAALFWPLTRRLAKAPTRSELRVANAALAARLQDQELATARATENEGRLQIQNRDLERRIAERTADLSTANARLVQALTSPRDAVADPLSLNEAARAAKG